MNDFKGTIRIDRKLWSAFKLYCETDLGTTISNKIRDMIEDEMGFNQQWLSNKNYEEETKVGVNARKIRLLEERIEKLESLISKADSKAVQETDDQTDDELSNQDSTGKLTDKPTDNKWSEETDELTDKIGENWSSPQTTLPDLPDYHCYSVAEVAELEGLTKTTISRYWTGTRMPKDATFWDRWKRNERRKGWYKAK